ncbi:ANTAR domain-containing protein [Catenuloplanes atrovinosus]|uniref:ANTAR domain-containing protein n=1 Tax=Catenuloplanes atrovinosus TaxID=137266 RepID=A0AAE3YV30_9ACTN|nr:ANTAR domain-containing protein [Catenuloplanes atrovinosus]MDR7278913.1 hypothetical protein [Catenuloplanes atrovinosus]
MTPEPTTSRAKDTLMRRFAISEAAAHRLIQRLAMDLRLDAAKAGEILRLGVAAWSEDPVHVIEFRETTWTLKHPVACRPNLFECPLNPLAEAMVDADGWPLALGRYECDINDLGDRLLIGDRIEEDTKRQPIPLANHPYIRCECDYFEHQNETTDNGLPLCDCGHLAEQHEDDQHACRMQDGDPVDVEYHPLVTAALQGGTDD